MPTLSSSGGVSLIGNYLGNGTKSGFLLVVQLSFQGRKKPEIHVLFRESL